MFSNRINSFLAYFKRYSSFHTINDIFRDKVSKDSVVVRGWVKNTRKLKNVIFVDINDGSIQKNLQVVLPKEHNKSNVSYGSSVEVSGSIQLNPSGLFELIPENFTVNGECSLMDGYPFAPKKSFSDDYLRQYLHLRCRTNKFSSLLRLRNRCRMAINEHFSENGFIQIDTPILTSNDCEGAGEVFKVIPDNPSLVNPKEFKNNSFFDVKTFLTVSGQLHLESAVRSLSQVYTFGPTFRAENSKSRLHLNEFYMVEAESSLLTNMNELTSLVESLVKSVTKYIADHCLEEALNYNKFNDTQRNLSEGNIKAILDNRFTVITYEEARLILKQQGVTVSDKEEISLTKEHELLLVEHNKNIPLFIVDWPVSLKPFYMRCSPSDKSKVQAFDLLCPIVGEVCGGSLREDNEELLSQRLEEHKLLDKLGWYLELRKYGNVLTGGYGLGFERLLQVLFAISNIKDTLPFPRWPHNCKL